MQGKRIRVSISSGSGLDVLIVKTSTATVRIPELSVVLMERTHREVTVRNLLEEIKTIVSSEEEIEQLLSGEDKESEYTLIVDDPAGLASISGDLANVTMSSERYQPTWQQCEEFDLPHPKPEKQFRNEEGVEKLVELLKECNKVVFLTGAGVSTESGIPAFRGTAGLGGTNIWDKFSIKDDHIKNFLASEQSRKNYWKMHAALAEICKDAKPNPSHIFAAYLAGQLEKDKNNKETDNNNKDNKEKEDKDKKEKDNEDKKEKEESKDKKEKDTQDKKEKETDNNNKEKEDKDKKEKDTQDKKEKEKNGKLLGVLTQNIDGLYQQAGLEEEKVVELHGTTKRVRCMRCSEFYSPAEIFSKMSKETNEKREERRKLAEQEGQTVSEEEIEEIWAVPYCTQKGCSGPLKPDTISFGQSLKEEVLDKALELVQECDMMIIMGTSLRVYPVAHFPIECFDRNVPVVILNMDATQYDDYATVLIQHKPCGEIVKELQARLEAENVM